MAVVSGLNKRIESFADFWPYYLQEHAKPLTRAFHYVGTGLSSLALLGFVLTGNLWLLLAYPVTGYGLAWVGHFFVEKNKPATFTYPFWSLLCDYRMVFRWLIGRLAQDLERAGVTESLR
jgi:hypothetical protein